MLPFIHKKNAVFTFSIIALFLPIAIVVFACVAHMYDTALHKILEQKVG